MKEFTINTPAGTLRAYETGDEEYPGIAVDLVKEDGSAISLSLTEYISGGEGVCDHVPSLSQMREQIAEVPKERLARHDGKELSEYLFVSPGNSFEYCITAGLVTRAWPDETNDPEYHKRVFHIGYDDVENEESEENND